MQLLPTKTNRDKAELLFLRLEHKLQYRSPGGLTWTSCMWTSSDLLSEADKYEFRKKHEPEIVYVNKTVAGGGGQFVYFSEEGAVAMAKGSGFKYEYFGKKFVEVMDDN